MVVAGRLLFDLYATKEAKYLKALQTLRKQIEEQPRAPVAVLAQENLSNQMWLDGLYMWGTTCAIHHNLRRLG
jgi:unsaturated rhamnogalacturonyl hydrolase